MNICDSEYVEFLRSLIVEHCPRIRRSDTLDDVLGTLWLGLATEADWIDCDDVRRTVMSAVLRVSVPDRFSSMPWPRSLGDRDDIPYPERQDEEPDLVSLLSSRFNLPEATVHKALQVEGAKDGDRWAMLQDCYGYSVPECRRRHRIAMEQMRLAIGVSSVHEGKPGFDPQASEEAFSSAQSRGTANR